MFKVLIYFGLLISYVMPAVGDDSAATNKLPVALIMIGESNDSLVERVTSWAEENLAIPVPVLPAQPETMIDSFEAVAEFGKGLLEPNRVGLVVLWRPSSTNETSHGAYYPDHKVAMVNLAAMYTEGTEQETIERRVERQVIRGICLAMGLEPNPNPQSAMFQYASMEELDAIGRNLDPPWLMRLQEKAMDVGIPVNAESPFNLAVPIPEPTEQSE